MIDKPLWEKVDDQMRGRFSDLTRKASDAISENSNITVDQAREAAPVIAAAGTGLLGLLLIDPLTAVGKFALKAVKSVVTGFGYFEKIPVLGGLFKTLGKGIDMVGEASGYLMTAAASLFAFRAFQANPEPKPEIDASAAMGGMIPVVALGTALMKPVSLDIPKLNLLAEPEAGAKKATAKQIEALENAAGGKAKFAELHEKIYGQSPANGIDPRLTSDRAAGLLKATEAFNEGRFQQHLIQPEVQVRIQKAVVADVTSTPRSMWKWIGHKLAPRWVDSVPSKSQVKADALKNAIRVERAIFETGYQLNASELVTSLKPAGTAAVIAPSSPTAIAPAQTVETISATNPGAADMQVTRGTGNPDVVAKIEPAPATAKPTIIGNTVAQAGVEGATNPGTIEIVRATTPGAADMQVTRNTGNPDVIAKIEPVPVGAKPTVTGNTVAQAGIEGATPAQASAAPKSEPVATVIVDGKSTLLSRGLRAGGNGIGAAMFVLGEEAGRHHLMNSYQKDDKIGMTMGGTEMAAGGAGAVIMGANIVGKMGGATKFIPGLGTVVMLADGSYQVYNEEGTENKIGRTGVVAAELGTFAGVAGATTAALGGAAAVTGAAVLAPVAVGAAAAYGVKKVGDYAMETGYIYDSIDKMFQPDHEKHGNLLVAQARLAKRLEKMGMTRDAEGHFDLSSPENIAKLSQAIEEKKNEFRETMKNKEVGWLRRNIFNWGDGSRNDKMAFESAKMDLHSFESASNELEDFAAQVNQQRLARAKEQTQAAALATSTNVGHDMQISGGSLPHKTPEQTPAGPGKI